MALFKPAESTSAFLKMGLLGFAGSGKTKTATITAIGLVQHAKTLKIPYADKPVFFIDTETGSDWVKPDFDKAGVPLMVAKTRAFVDLLASVEEAQNHGSLLLIDSISHFWKELCDSYSRRKAAQFKTATYRLQFQDWGYLKGEWGKFTDAFINSPLHIILCGRAGYEYDYFENDEGKKELEKTGVKMKAEGEMGYEPSLLVLMERNQKIESGTVAASWREATVLKDRSTLLDGKVFVDPKFSDFAPHIKMLNLGGKQLGVDTSRTSEHAVQVEKKDWHSTQKAIVLEEIEAVLVEHYPSTKAEDKTAKAALILKHFGTRSWTEVTNMRVEELRQRYDYLYRELKGEPSRYTAINAERAKGDGSDLGDSLPDHSAPIPADVYYNPDAESFCTAGGAPMPAEFEATWKARAAEFPHPLRGPGPREDAPLAPAQPELSLEQKLLGDLANNKTIPDCLKWAIDVNNTHRAALGEDAFNRVNAALMARQTEIYKAAAKPDLNAVDPNTDAPAFLTREPKPDSKPKGKAKATSGGDGAVTPAPALQAEAGGMYGLIQA